MADPRVGGFAGRRGAPDQPLFFFDLGCAEAYLAAERVLQDLPAVAEWMPVLARALPGAGLAAPSRAAIERLAAERGLQPLRWPPPFDSEPAMRAATYAKQGGKTVQFSLAAFRQAFAGGRDLGVTDNVLIAAAACEMHPRAVLTALDLRGVREALEQATAAAAAAGVRDVPAVLVGERVFHGDAGIDAAAALLSP